MNAWSSRLAGVDGGEVLLEDVGGRARCPARTAAAISTAVIARRHSASPMIGGTRKRPSTASGRGGEHLVAVEAGLDDVVAQHVAQRVRLRHRLDGGEVELVDVGEVLEHVAELGRRAVDLVVGQRQPGQPGHVDHVGGRDAVGHGGEASGGPPFCRGSPRGDSDGGTARYCARAMATVTFAGATRTYRGLDHPAVDHLDLEIADGEFLVLVGPSGCGKSTTLRMLAGLEPVDEGTIHIGDRDVTDVPPKDRDIAMVFQSYALYPHMTVAENIGFHLKVKRMPQGRAGPAGARGGRDPRPRASTSTASRPSCRAASASGWRWAGRSCASRRCS